MSRLMCLVVLMLIGRVAGGQEFPLAPLVECSPRAGLANFIAKATQGGDVRVAYLGGSITAQEGWRPKSLAMLQAAFPKAKVSQVNAAIGGTGSDLGVFRLKQDVLDHKPDLLFVEFAVNDGGTSPERIIKCVEGIVRQAWRALPECDVCFVYTVTESLVPPLYEGKMQRSASAMEKVAEHYGIPTIHMGVEVAKLAKAGTLLWKQAKPKTDEERKAVEGKVLFAPDGVHPFPDTGHALYVEAIERSWPAIAKASFGGPAGAPRALSPHNLEAPVRADNYENAKIVPLAKLKLSKGVAKLDAAKDSVGKRFANRLPELHKATKAGETIEFKFRGTYAAIYDVIGPDCGQVSVAVDGGAPAIKPRFDAYCTYHRLAQLGLVADAPEAVHTVKITLDAKQPDKVKILAQRGEKMDKPERFDGTAWYPGAVMIVGELVE
ncbi:MAG: SGNH/GDSL hydrolase family protein [Phycisphaerae bacterium]